MDTVADPKRIAVQFTLINWNLNREKAESLLHTLSDEAFENEVAPGRNRGRYLIGHLIAEHDEMAGLIGERRQYEHYDALFLHSPDRSGKELPSMAELRSVWSELHERLTAYMTAMSPEDWFGRHSRISAEGFVHEPHRNRLAVLTNRNVHFGYHLGQLALLKG